MDDLSIGGGELAEALAQLRRINRLTGAAWPTVEGVARLWRAAGCPTRLSILDVGAGSGDVNRRLLAWAGRRHVQIELTLMDIHPDTCAVAAAYYQDEPRVRVIQGDVFQLPPGQADIVTASLFVHHFPAGQLPEVFRAMLRAARLGVVVNDLHRHWLAWSFIRAATGLLSRNRMIRHDAPLSVWRGFQAAELEALRAAPGLEQLTYAWRPLFRYLMVVPKNGERAE
jgi:SAM-dependent methyltransferase